MDSKDREIAELRALVAALTKRVAELELELAKAKKDSSTSSKPPSSDLVKPKPKNKKPGRRKKPRRGAQPGHGRAATSPQRDRPSDHTRYARSSGATLPRANVDSDSDLQEAKPQLLHIPLRIDYRSTPKPSWAQPTVWLKLHSVPGGRCGTSQSKTRTRTRSRNVTVTAEGRERLPGT